MVGAVSSRRPPGKPVARLIAEGEVDLGFQQLPELVGPRGVRILGVLPAGCAIDTVFAGGVATTSTDAAASEALLAFSASVSATPIKVAHDFEDASAGDGGD